jgi:hypothetical protein
VGKDYLTEEPSICYRTAHQMLKIFYQNMNNILPLRAIHEIVGALADDSPYKLLIVINHACEWMEKLHNLQESLINQTTDTAGFIYLMKWGSIYKIGRSLNADSRYTSIKGNYQKAMPIMPYELKLIFKWWVKNMYEIEKYIHELFSDKRLSGEWFKLEKEDVLNIIKTIKLKENEVARKRMIDPIIWTDEGFLELSISARFLFIGLISHADDEGKGLGSAKCLKSKIFPGDNITFEDIEKYKKEIEKVLRVSFYKVNGKEYYKLLTWVSYQSIKHKKESSIPNPCPTQGRHESDASSPDGEQSSPQLINKLIHYCPN